MRRNAFTLAEVLITLGIIGVVAAMTLPGVIANYQQKQTILKLKKMHSLIMNAENLSVIENGEAKDWPFKHINASSAMDFFEKYYLPYIKIAYKIRNEQTYKIGNMTGNKSIAYTGKRDFVHFADGSCLYLWSNTQFFVMTYDVNCSKKPNILGKDVFDIFEFNWYAIT